MIEGRLSSRELHGTATLLGFPAGGACVIRKLLVLLVLFIGAGSLAVLALRTTPGGVSSYSMVGAPLALLTGADADDDYSLSLLRYFRIAATKVTTDYVDPARVEPIGMLQGALDQVARDVPEFLYELDERSGTLKLVAGLETQELTLPTLDGVPELASLMTEVAGFLDDKLSAEVPRREVEYALMNGMLKTLDPHSFFIDPDSFEEMQVNNDGHFGGLGITIGIREERLTILYPLADTPAWRAGLKAGDHIDKIGRESTVNMELNEAVRKLRGAEGTQVTITVSDDEGMEREVTVTRARIEVDTVKYAYAGDGVGYVQVLHFARQTYDSLDEALDDLDTRAIEDGQGHLKGLVLDLRGNPGGYLEQAVLMADKFIRTGTIVSGLLDVHLNTNPLFPAVRPQLGVGQVINVGGGLHIQAQGGVDLEFWSDPGMQVRYVGGANIFYQAAENVGVFAETSTNMKHLGGEGDLGSFRFNIITFGLRFAFQLQ